MSAIRTVALLAAIALLAHSVMTQNVVGRILTAVWSDVTTFCERQPQACADSRTLAGDLHRSIAPDSMQPDALAGHSPPEQP